MGDQKTVVVAPTKSVGIAFLLCFLFGPLGMFYSTILGAVIMIFVTIVLGVTTIVGALLGWAISIIWGCAAASSYNKKMYLAGMNQS